MGWQEDEPAEHAEQAVRRTGGRAMGASGHAPSLKLP